MKKSKARRKEEIESLVNSQQEMLRKLQSMLQDIKEEDCKHEWIQIDGFEASDRTCSSCGRHEAAFNYY